MGASEKALLIKGGICSPTRMSSRPIKAITGGAGTILGATLGSLVLGVISIALVVLRISPFWEQAIQGALIVAAVAIDTLLARSLAQRMMRKRDHG